MSITFERSEDELLLILTPERIDIQDILEILRKRRRMAYFKDIYS